MGPFRRWALLEGGAEVPQAASGAVRRQALVHLNLLEENSAELGIGLELGSDLCDRTPSDLRHPIPRPSLAGEPHGAGPRPGHWAVRGLRGGGL